MKRSSDYVDRLREWNKAQVLGLAKRGLLKPDINPMTTLIMNTMITTMGVKAKQEVVEKISKIALRGAQAPERTKNVGVGISYGPGFRTQMPIESMYEPNDGFNQGSALTLKEKQGDFWIQCDYDGELKMPVNIWEGPSWYPRQIPNKEDPENPFTLSQLVQSELGVLMLSIPDKDGFQRCTYIERDEGCKMCGMETDYQPLTPELLVEIVEMDLQENQTNITMTGGNNYTADRGIKKYIPFVEALRKRFGEELPIQLEISPPQQEEYLEWMAENKLSAWFNLEMFPFDKASEILREKVMPAKSKIPLEDYFQSFKFLNNRGLETYSVLIAGLQPLEGIYKGAEALAEIGTTTAVLPFKPNADSAYQSRFPCSVPEFIEATMGVDKILRERGLDLTSRSENWCSGCGGCGADRNYAFNREQIVEAWSK